jgi:hypothetical protein
VVGWFGLDGCQLEPSVNHYAFQIPTLVLSGGRSSSWSGPLIQSAAIDFRFGVHCH